MFLRSLILLSLSANQVSAAACTATGEAACANPSYPTLPTNGLSWSKSVRSGYSTNLVACVSGTEEAHGTECALQCGSYFVPNGDSPACCDGSMQSGDGASCVVSPEAGCLMSDHTCSCAGSAPADPIIPGSAEDGSAQCATDGGQFTTACMCASRPMKGNGCKAADGTCSCDHGADQVICEAEGSSWSSSCNCEAMIDVGFTWFSPARSGELARWEGNMGSVGDHIRMWVSGNDVALHDGSCGGIEVVQPKPDKGTLTMTYLFNRAGTYHFTTTEEGMCAGGMTFTVVIDTDKADIGPNEHDTSILMAPPHGHTSPGPDDAFVQFGKGVYHAEVVAMDLHTACPAGMTCIDREYDGLGQDAEGSCYYSGEDMHIGHAVVCGVSEVQCCGFAGCRGALPDGTAHGARVEGGGSYYWYSKGFMSSMSGCCHCLEGCDEDQQTPRSGACKHYDVTTEVCQRHEDWDSEDEYDTIGRLTCEKHSDADAIICVREPSVGSTRVPCFPEADTTEAATTEASHSLQAHPSFWIGIGAAVLALLQQ